VIFVIGRWAVKLSMSMTCKPMLRARLDEMLIKFLTKLAYAALLAFMVVAGLDSLGVNTTAFAEVGDAVATQQPPPLKPELLLPGETFHVANHPAFVMLPEAANRKKPQPWIWYFITRPDFPDHHEKWMHEQFVTAGIAVAGVDVGESFGSPQGRKVFDAFYKEMTAKRGFARKPFIFARSRGGLQASGWAIENAEKVAGIGGFYPVFDLRSYPGLEKAAPVYGMTVKELEAALPKVNPVARLHVLARAKVPAFFIQGDLDEVVPLEKNTAAFVAAYEANGAKDKVGFIVAKGQGHNYWPGFFRCTELIDFAIIRAGEGAHGSK
jgi:hypothetical protein